MVCNILDMFINILRLRVVIRTASIVRPLLTVSSSTLIIDLEGRLVPEVDAYNVRRAWLAGQLILRAPLLNHMAKVSTAKINL